MTARPFASGTISFGLVTVPVKLYSTGETASGIQLNMLHRKCGTRLKQQYICPTDEQVVGRDEMIKGYEYAKGQYVLFSDEELKALTPEPTNAIEITEFVPAEEVDPVYFEKSTYLGPDKGGDKPYRLLSQAMRETGRAAVARYAARGKDYLVLLRPYQDGLIMQQLRYADEIRSFSEVPVAPSEVKEPELRLAMQLIEQIAADEFHPEVYEDNVRKRTRDLIEQKVQGQEIQAAPPEAPKAQIIDLMEALKASLAAAQPKGQPRGKSQEPIPIASRKPPKASPRKTAEETATTADETAPKKRSSKR